MASLSSPELTTKPFLLLRIDDCFAKVDFGALPLRAGRCLSNATVASSTRSSRGQHGHFNAPEWLGSDMSDAAYSCKHSYQYMYMNIRTLIWRRQFDSKNFLTLHTACLQDFVMYQSVSEAGFSKQTGQAEGVVLLLNRNLRHLQASPITKLSGPSRRPAEVFH